jgi:hypothetical protein
MATQTAFSAPDFFDPFFLHPNESSSTSIIPFVFKGDNYHTWSRVMLRALHTKNSFIDGSISCPVPSNAKFGAWDRCNCAVLSWLLQSLYPPIMASVLWMNYTKFVWKNSRSAIIKGIYSELLNYKNHCSRFAKVILL